MGSLVLMEIFESGNLSWKVLPEASKLSELFAALCKRVQEEAKTHKKRGKGYAKSINK